MKRRYISPEAVLRAASRTLGGRVMTYDGHPPVLAIDKRNEYEQVVTTYLSACGAAEQADLRYSGNEDETPTACSCGWDGKVIPGAHGQRCPFCGESLT